MANARTSMPRRRKPCRSAGSANPATSLRRICSRCKTATPPARSSRSTGVRCWSDLLAARARRLLVQRAAGADQIVGGVDQRDVTESLREIAELAFGARIVFFGQQTDI